MLSTFILYSVEFLDEFIYGLQGAILPELRADLALSYTQVGLLATIPGLIGIALEPFVGILGDTRYRRALVLSGILATTLGLFVTGLAPSFAIILVALCVLFVASGAYVNLAQATLIDRNPLRAEQPMARWTSIGSLAGAAAPICVTALFWFGYEWREMYLALGFFALVFVLLLLRPRFDAHSEAQSDSPSPRGLSRNLWRGLRNRELLRWVALTELADLMLDKFLEVTGLYFYDVVGVSLAEASGAVAIATTAWLAGNALLVPMLEKFRGTLILRVSAVLALTFYAAFLLVPLAWVKFVLLVAIGLSTSGWFAIMRARTFAVLPGQSGLIIAVTSLGNISSVFVPVLPGALADTLSLERAMWLLAVGPFALIVGLPKERRS